MCANLWTRRLPGCKLSEQGMNESVSGAKKIFRKTEKLFAESDSLVFAL
jgi:hypothetical protein